MHRSASQRVRKTGWPRSNILLEQESFSEGGSSCGRPDLFSSNISGQTARRVFLRYLRTQRTTVLNKLKLLDASYCDVQPPLIWGQVIQLQGNGSKGMS